MLCSFVSQACSPSLHKNHARWLWRHFALDVFHFCFRRPLRAQRCIGFGRDMEMLTSGWLVVRGIIATFGVATLVSVTPHWTTRHKSAPYNSSLCTTRLCTSRLCTTRLGIADRHDLAEFGTVRFICARLRSTQCRADFGRAQWCKRRVVESGCCRAERLGSAPHARLGCARFRSATTELCTTRLCTTLHYSTLYHLATQVGTLQSAQRGPAHLLWCTHNRRQFQSEKLRRAGEHQLTLKSECECVAPSDLTMPLSARFFQD